MRLIAFVTASRPTAARLLREYVCDRLPAYMVPSAFIILDRLPLTPTGKIDRLSLPVPDFNHPESEFVAPRNATEGVLAEVWAELLDVQRVGVHDHFFELGGHSLLAMRLTSRVRALFSMDLSLRRFLEMPTLEALALMIDELHRPPISAE